MNKYLKYGLAAAAAVVTMNVVMSKKAEIQSLSARAIAAIRRGGRAKMAARESWPEA